MTASAVCLVVGITAGVSAQLGMTVNLVRYKLVIFSLHEIFWSNFSRLNDKESVTVNVIMSNSPYKTQI